jgi:capsule synthesis protein PGA_cap
VGTPTLEGLARLLVGVDLVVVNHEGPVTTREGEVGKADTGRKRYWYRALPDSLRALVDADVGVAALANNHVLDFGPDGLADTIAALDQAGIARCGAGMDEAQARVPAIVELGGVRIGFLSVMQRYHLYAHEGLYASDDRAGPRRLRRRTVREDLARLGGKADLRVVLVHWAATTGRCRHDGSGWPSSCAPQGPTSSSATTPTYRSGSTSTVASRSCSASAMASSGRAAAFTAGGLRTGWW